MKAIVQDGYGSSEVLQLAVIDTPAIGDDEVLVRVHASALHMGDWHLMTGQPYLLRLGFGLRGPKTSVRGMDVAGRVEAVGKSVTELRVGDEVFGTCEGGLDLPRTGRIHHAMGNAERRKHPGRPGPDVDFFLGPKDLQNAARAMVISYAGVGTKRNQTGLAVMRDALHSLLVLRETAGRAVSDEGGEPKPLVKVHARTHHQRRVA